MSEFLVVLFFAFLFLSLLAWALVDEPEKQKVEPDDSADELMEAELDQTRRKLRDALYRDRDDLAAEAIEYLINLKMMSFWRK